MKMKDIELLIKMPEKVYNALTHTEFDANLVVDEMRKPIANGTPLVRCKDCRYGITAHGISNGGVLCSKPYTERGNAMHRTDWFCADGERERMMNGKVFCDPETGKIYEDLDGIRLVYENGEKVGWYRPDGWAESEEAEDVLQTGYERDIRADGSVLIRPRM